jgi:formate dehydrogenase subunit gamma
MVERELCKVINRLKDKKNALIPLLHVIQERYGYIPPHTIDLLSDELNLSKAEVWGVLTFYSDFKLKPPGKHIIKVCRSEACLAMGGKAVQEYIRQRLKIDFGQTTLDGLFTLEDLYCFGNCACAPSVMVDGKLYGRVFPEKIDALIEEILSGELKKDERQV